MTSIAIVTSGFLPIPAVRGGSVENILDNIIKENECYTDVELTILSIYDEAAEKISSQQNYTHTIIKYIHIPNIIKIVDYILYWFMKNIIKKEKHISWRYIFQRLWFIYLSGKHLHKYNYDRVLLENHNSLFLALKYKKNFKKYFGHYYYHIHNEVHGYYGCKKIIINSKRFLCVSMFIATFVEQYFQISGINISILRNCIDIERFAQPVSQEKLETLRNKLGIKYNDIIILFSGRLTKEKGIKEALSAFATINPPNAKFIILGAHFAGTGMTSHYEEELYEIASNINDKVIFTGFVPYEQIHMYYQIANIAVLPSIWNEPALVSCIEAATTGLAIISTRVGGIPEYLSDEFAILLDINDKLEENIRKAFLKLLNNPILTKNMANKASAFMRNYTFSNYYNNLLEYLEIC